MSLRASLAVVLALTVSALAGAPFRFEATPGRLPKSVVPSAYRVHFTPDLEKAEISGSESITIQVREAVREIVLNAAGLQITRADLLHPEKSRAQPLQAETYDSAQLLKLTASSPIPPGTYTLELAWKGKLTEQPQGIFLTRYPTPSGVEKKAVATEMEPADARRFFPCWDEPVFRATFELTAVVPQAHMALSNMPIVEETPAAAGLKTVHFAPTPSMATYLVAFATGEFEAIEEDFSGVRLRIITTEGKKEHGRYALEATKQLLTYFNDYFGAPYPLPKLDQFCYPGFPSGGMENWGAIFYNDTTLLVDPQTASQNTRERVYGVVAHEIAHQWFGDLVTMAWWDNLWLNEGFASWMGNKSAARFNPDWQLTLRGAGAKEWAMARDARKTTHPIQQKIESESQAADVFDEITYSKGEAFLRMLETWLGEEPFRAGIRAYMKKHAYGSATTADLWAALAEASGKPVPQVAASWTEQPGFPVVLATAKCDAGRLSVTVAQQRFTIHQKDAPALTWPIPAALAPLSALAQPQRVLLGAEGQSLTFGACDDPVIANVGGIGYYRVAYDDETFAQLAARITSLPDAERLALFGDTWALVQAGRAPAARVFGLLESLAPTEQSYPVWEQILYALGFMDHLHRAMPGRAAFRQWAAGLLQPRFRQLGWEPRAGESALDRALRGSFISNLGEWEDAAVVQRAQGILQQHIANPAEIPGDLRGAVLTIGARSATAELYGQLHEAAKREPSTEIRSRIYRALGASRDRTLAQKTLALSLTDELPPGQGANLVDRVARDGEQPELAWEFAKAHEATLRAKLNSIRANEYMPDIARAFTDAKWAAALEQFAKEKLPAEATPSVEIATDDIRFKAEFKARLLPELAAWLQPRAR